MEEASARKLSELGSGTYGIVASIDGGYGFVQRLAEMGIAAGTEVRVLRGRGPMIVEVKGQRLVIGHGMVDRILVEALPPRCDT